MSGKEAIVNQNIWYRSTLCRSLLYIVVHVIVFMQEAYFSVGQSFNWEARYIGKVPPKNQKCFIVILLLTGCSFKVSTNSLTQSGHITQVSPPNLVSECKRKSSIPQDEEKASEKCKKKKLSSGKGSCG